MTLIAIDWGTSVARAYRLDDRGDVIDERNAPLGIANIADRRFDIAFRTLLGDWIDDPAPRVACGMIGSRQGWIEAPYVDCPVALDTLATAIVRIDDASLSIVPGLRTRDRYGTPDVMRGEETQLVGAVLPDENPVLAVLPGTHSKWARVACGSVVDFVTFMTGELYAVLLAHTILGRMSERVDSLVIGEAFLRGVDRGLVAADPTHAIFGARTLVLSNELDACDVDDWLSGALIGAEIRAARAWADGAGIGASRARIIGNDSLSARYEAALARAGIATDRVNAQAAARGLWRIARQAGLVH